MIGTVGFVQGASEGRLSPKDLVCGGTGTLFCEKARVAGVTGLEPAASGVTGRRSNQLSYTPM